MRSWEAIDFKVDIIATHITIRIILKVTGKTASPHRKTLLEQMVDLAVHLHALGAVDGNGSPDPRMFVTTEVDSQDVVDAELVKKAIQFDGTTSTMETCLDELMVRMATLEGEIAARSLGLKPIVMNCRRGDANRFAKQMQKPRWPLQIPPPLAGSNPPRQDIRIVV